MTWLSLDPAIRALAEQHLTDQQLAAWKLELDDLGTRTISLRLDTARSTIRDRLSAAHRTLRRHGVMQTEAGVYYLKEAA